MLYTLQGWRPFFPSGEFEYYFRNYGGEFKSPDLRDQINKLIGLFLISTKYAPAPINQVFGNRDLIELIADQMVNMPSINMVVPPTHATISYMGKHLHMGTPAQCCEFIIKNNITWNTNVEINKQAHIMWHWRSAGRKKYDKETMQVVRHNMFDMSMPYRRQKLSVPYHYPFHPYGMCTDYFNGSTLYRNMLSQAHRPHKVAHRLRPECNGLKFSVPPYIELYSRRYAKYINLGATNGVPVYNTNTQLTFYGYCW